MKSARKRHILEEHYLDFYSRAVSILDDEDDAKDAVQEAVVKTLVSVGVRDMVAYCYRATEHECVNILRRRSKVMRIDDSDIAAVDDALLRQLPMERQVMELRRDHGYSNAETAVRVGVSVSTVKRILSSAEKKIVNNMKHEI